MNPKITQHADTVLAVVACARNVFGGHSAPAAPPEFAAPRDLQDNLGRGHF